MRDEKNTSREPNDSDDFVWDENGSASGIEKALDSGDYSDYAPFFDYRRAAAPEIESTEIAEPELPAFYAFGEREYDSGLDSETETKPLNEPEFVFEYNSADAEATAIMPKIPRTPIAPREEYGEDYGGAGAAFVDATPTIGMGVIKSANPGKPQETDQNPPQNNYELPDPEQFFRSNRNERDDPDFEDEKPMLIPQGGGTGALQIARRERIRDLKRDAAVRTAGQIFAAVLLVLAITGLSVFLAYYAVRGALDFVGIDTNDFVTQVTIPPAATTEDIAEILHNNGIIDMPELFVMYSRLTGKEGEFLNGTFTVRSTMHYGGIADVLMRPKYYEEIVTLQITEGMAADDIGALLEENRICSAADFREYYKTKLNIYNFEKRVTAAADKYYQLEGYLFPDTYEFYVCDELDEDLSLLTAEDADKARKKMKEAAKTAAQKMYAAFNNTITKEMYRRMYDMGLTLNDTITLASMVQKEAATEEDMELVASVFLNRLHNSESFPQLQSDVTLMYAENYIRARIRPQDESAYQPLLDAYNTYASDGLPPGPICNPGLDAIMAVLNAPQTNYYYFCADTTTLQIYYATTITEHEANLAMIGLNAGDAQAVHRNSEDNG
jgi:UPF0755 protein